jgi:hypothetical protein
VNFESSIQNSVDLQNLLSYLEIPEHYAWKQRIETWIRQQRAWNVFACMKMAPQGLNNSILECY